MEYESLKHLKLALIINYNFAKKYDYSYNIIDYSSFLLIAGVYFVVVLPNEKIL